MSEEDGLPFFLCHTCDKLCTVERIPTSHKHDDTTKKVDILDTPAHTEGWAERFDTKYLESILKAFPYPESHVILLNDIKDFIKSERELLKREIKEAIEKNKSGEIGDSWDTFDRGYSRCSDDITNIINNIK